MGKMITSAMRLEIIQIVEDDQAQTHLLDRTLRKACFRTSVASDDNEGWQAIERIRPDSVLLDIMMPGTEGYELCRRLAVLMRHRGPQPGGECHMNGKLVLE